MTWKSVIFQRILFFVKKGRHMGILDCIGNTPLVSLEAINPFPKVKILVKLEGNNPGGSVKGQDSLLYDQGC